MAKFNPGRVLGRLLSFPSVSDRPRPFLMSARAGDCRAHSGAPLHARFFLPTRTRTVPKPKTEIQHDPIQLRWLPKNLQIGEDSAGKLCRCPYCGTNSTGSRQSETNVQADNHRPNGRFATCRVGFLGLVPCDWGNSLAVRAGRTDRTRRCDIFHVGVHERSYVFLVSTRISNLEKRRWRPVLRYLAADRLTADPPSTRFENSFKKRLGRNANNWTASSLFASHLPPIVDWNR